MARELDLVIRNG